jgi:hypothetical protein
MTSIMNQYREYLRVVSKDREVFCDNCQGDGVMYAGQAANSPDTPTRGGYECWECNGRGYKVIPHRHITVRELVGEYGPYVEASCAGKRRLVRRRDR